VNSDGVWKQCEGISDKCGAVGQADIIVIDALDESAMRFADEPPLTSSARIASHVYLFVTVSARCAPRQRKIHM